MTELSDDTLLPLQREVERLLGRCLLQLQQYEHLMKGIVAHHKLSARADACNSVRAKRVAKVERSMLGLLVSELLKSFLVTDETARNRQDEIDEESNIAAFSYHMQIVLSEEDFEKAKVDLKDLVDLRNNLIHHFIDRYDLQSSDGCRIAQEVLIIASRDIKKHFKRLHEWGEDMERTRQHLLELMKSDEFRDVVMKGAT